MSLHILLLSAPSPLLLHPLLLEVVGAVKHIKKRKHELTSEEHQSSFNLNFSAGFCSCFYMKEVAFVAPCTCSCFLQGGQTESFSGLWVCSHPGWAALSSSVHTWHSSPRVLCDKTVSCLHLVPICILMDQITVGWLLAHASMHSGYVWAPTTQTTFGGGLDQLWPHSYSIVVVVNFLLHSLVEDFVCLWSFYCSLWSWHSSL